jgi:hypothetical protein
MSAHASPAAIDVARSRTAHPRLALALALIAVPGVILPWGVVPGGGFTTGVPIAIAALVIAIRARPGRMATAAAMLAGVCLAFVAICALTI